jgi:7,8-dihydropterin-6-yl-methyl-4-(beta-D-ribofuranosyl)aminobenzene 5'-phosphate synthase
MTMMTISVVYDSLSLAEGFDTGWGFACVISGGEKTILFDTGQKGDALRHNLKALNISPNQIDLIVVSHDHTDHTGGLLSFLTENSHVTVFLPPSFSKDFLGAVQGTGANTVIVNAATQICKNVFVATDTRNVAEQCLVLQTQKGLVLVTGCAHPGIVRVAMKVRDYFEDKIDLALGGFHLFRSADEEIRKTVGGLRDVGVARVAPCHCTGNKAIRVFKEVYGDAFIEVGVGSPLQISF